MNCTLIFNRRKQVPLDDIALRTKATLHRSIEDTRGALDFPIETLIILVLFTWYNFNMCVLYFVHILPD